MVAAELPTESLPNKLRGRHGDPLKRIQGVVDRAIRGVEAPRILEAGCGSLSRIRLPQDSYIVGIDIEERQLTRNTSLDEKILGDIQTLDLPPSGFDVIVCWDVIEHLDDPVAALNNMAQALRPGGVIILAFPNLWSLKGLVTKLTPFRVHALFYRYVIGDKRERHESDQFPTFLRLAVAPPRLRGWARSRGLTIAHDEVYEGPVQQHLRKRNALANAAFGALGAGSRFFSAGKLDLGLSDGVLIVQLPDTPA